MKDRIRQLMISQHMTQQSFAEYIGISSASLSSIFNNFNAKSATQIPQIKEFLDSINKEDLDTVKQVVTKLG